jgi:hypothetical protein
MSFSRAIDYGVRLQETAIDGSRAGISVEKMSPIVPIGYITWKEFALERAKTVAGNLRS